MTRFVVIGNPGSRRVAQFQQALARCGLPAAEVISYIDLLAGRPAEAMCTGTVVRVESPGQDFAVERALLAEGAADAEAEGSPVISESRLDRLEFDRGRILHPRQWYLGYGRLLERVDAALRPVEGLRLMNSPAEIAVMFDKPRCHALCAAADIPVPPVLGVGSRRTDFQSIRETRADDHDPPRGALSVQDSRPRGRWLTDGLEIRPTTVAVASYDELVFEMEQADVRRVFVKLAHGSSASGVVALQRHRGRHVAVTSVETVRTAGEVRLYNSRRLQRYTAESDLRQLIDTLARERIHVERWLPKAGLDAATTFDLRVVTIAGEPRHMVVRQGRGPMTNLHLGNRRGDPAALLARLGPERLASLHDTCRRVARLFPGSLHTGLDVLLTPGFHRHAVLEVNAFGDLLPGVLWEGMDAYEAQVRWYCDGAANGA